MSEKGSRIEKTWTQFPGEPFAQDALAALLPRWLPESKLGLARQLFRRSGVERRHLVLRPDEATLRGRSFADKNRLYKASIAREAAALCEQIRASVSARDLATVDLLVTTSCTGFQIPALDAPIIQGLGLPLGLRRVNLTEHGCAAGAQALGLAHEWLAARPEKRALVVSAELCSLAFQAEDVTDENLVSAAIFGDGAAAVLVAGPDASPGPGEVVIRGAFREFFPGTEYFMGFDVDDAGLKIKLSKDVVPFTRSSLGALIGRACDRWNLPGPEAFAFGALHPGGRRILEAFEDHAGMSKATTRTSWECLASYGNLSSASVLVTLDRTLATLEEPEGSGGALGLLSAFGPGFGAELLLLEARAPGRARRTDAAG